MPIPFQCGILYLKKRPEKSKKKQKWKVLLLMLYKKKMSLYSIVQISNITKIIVIHCIHYCMIGCKEEEEKEKTHNLFVVEN